HREEYPRFFSSFAAFMDAQSINDYSAVESMARSGCCPGTTGPFAGECVNFGFRTASLDWTIFCRRAAYKPFPIDRNFLFRPAFGVGSGWAEKFYRGLRV